MDVPQTSEVAHIGKSVVIKESCRAPKTCTWTQGGRKNRTPQPQSDRGPNGIVKRRDRKAV